MDLSIFVVTYNSAKLIGQLLTHLHSEFEREGDHLHAEVIVVDNASRDGTADFVRRNFPWVKLVASTLNLGFAAGNNLAAQQAVGRHLLLLNPDAMPEPGSLRAGVALMDAHPEVGLGGGELLGTDGSRQPSARMFPTLRDEIFTLSGLAARHPTSRLFARLDRRWANPDDTATVDWIPGAFVFVPMQAFRQLGGFDERFFMYYEEVDLCRRLHGAGLSVQYWPSLKAVHIGGASAKTVEHARVSRAGSQLESWRMRSALLYYRKHHGALAARGLHLIEWGWTRLRQFKAGLLGQRENAADFAAHCLQLRQAWIDTHAGTLSPPRPW
jgi:GT2 family glycosyltransferase